MALTPNTRIWLARGIAAVADLLQATLFPLFAEGFLSPLNAVVDCVVALLMWWLVAGTSRSCPRSYPSRCRS